MRHVLNILLIAVCIGVGYLIYANIKEPIIFAAELDKRESAVAIQLDKIRTAQEIYKKITGKYAASFDSLKYVLKNENIETYKIVGNLDDENTETEIETLYTKAIDSMRSLSISIDSLDYVPFGKEGAEYSIDADTLTYQNTLVNVVEVGIRKEDFMGKYADPSYQKYNAFYDPKDKLKFGDMTSPNTSGNWKN